MKVLTAVIALTTCSVVAVSAQGCRGPTAAGKKARAEARERYDRFNSEVIVDQAKQSLANGRLTEALDLADKLVSRFPDERQFRLLRGQVLAEMQRYTPAMTDFVACQCDVETGQGVVAAAGTPGEQPEPREFEDEAEKLGEILAAAPCWYHAGLVAERVGDTARAENSFRMASVADPTQLEYRMAHLECLLAMGRTADAEEELAAVQLEFPYETAPRHLQAQVTSLNGDHDAAARALRNTALLAADDAAVQEELLHAEFRAANWGRCLALLASGQIPQSSERADLVRLRARCLLMTSRAIAARDLLLATRRLPAMDCAEYWELIGFTAWIIGDRTRLAEAAATLRSMDATDSLGHVFEAALARQDGREEDALLAAERALEIEPDDALARALARRGETEAVR